MSDEPMFPGIQIPGVPQDQLFRLYGASNWPYYMQQVHDIKIGRCPFCQIDTSLNVELPDYRNTSWRVWNNPVAPRAGQLYQFVIPLRRHAVAWTELLAAEMYDLHSVISYINEKFNVTGGVLVMRGGNPLKHAGSVAHLHANYHAPTGIHDVKVTLAKSMESLERKRSVIVVWEKMRVMFEEQSINNPFDYLSLEEMELVKDTLKSPELIKK